MFLWDLWHILIFCNTVSYVYYINLMLMLFIYLSHVVLRKSTVARCSYICHMFFLYFLANLNIYSLQCLVICLLLSLMFVIWFSYWRFCVSYVNYHMFTFQGFFWVYEKHIKRTRSYVSEICRSSHFLFSYIFHMFSAPYGIRLSYVHVICLSYVYEVASHMFVICKIA